MRCLHDDTNPRWRNGGFNCRSCISGSMPKLGCVIIDEAVARQNARGLLASKLIQHGYMKT